MTGSPPTYRTRRALAGVALLAGLGVAHVLAAKPANRALAVQLKKMGGGPAKKTVRGLRIVDGSTGEVLAASRVGTTGKATLRPQASVAFAVATVARPSGMREGISPIFRYEPGARAVKLKIPLQPVAAPVLGVATVAGMPRTVAPIRTLLAPPGSPVATMGDVTMSGADGGGSISGPLFTPLFNQTSDSIVWVDTGGTFTQARQHELDLQNQGRTDPATQITDSAIPPDLVVEGTLAYDGNRVTGELRIVDPRTGEVVVRIPVDVDEGDWAKLMDQLARELARRLRERAATTTTTTSTTGTSATTTTPTSPSSTLTQPPGTTPTTLPPGGTCTSVIADSFCACVGLGGACTSDADCQRRGGTTCVDIVGHTLVTYRLAGSGGLLGALKIDGTEYGLWGPPEGGVLTRGGCGTNAFLQGAVPPLRPDETVCPAYYHPGATITLQAWRRTSALTPPPGGGIYCPVEFTGWGGAVSCAGMGDCDDQICRCGTSTATGAFEVVATYTAQEDNGHCVPPAAP